MNTSHTKKRTNHTFHLWMTIFTCGLWGMVWLGVAIWNASGINKQKTTHR